MAGLMEGCWEESAAEDCAGTTVMVANESRGNGEDVNLKCPYCKHLPSLVPGDDYATVNETIPRSDTMLEIKTEKEENRIY